MLNIRMCLAGVLSAGILLPLAACCSSRTTMPEAGKLTMLTETNANNKVTLAAGSAFDIRLKANATTGYNWKLDEINSAVVEQTGKMDYVTDSHAEGMVGVGGTAIFHFAVKSAGVTTLKFSYSRPWENVAPSQTYSVSIEAK